MDRIREFDRSDDDGRDYEIDGHEGVETPSAIGTDERRMHVRAYNYWVSLLDGRAYPSIEDLDPASIDDFGPNSVLLDFTAGVENPAVAWLGRALREECGLGQEIRRISDVPSRSLLSRLTDHYLQIIANRAPIGFEAEFVGKTGANTVYRGILMPFSSDDDNIDFIYGVINWKELAAPDLSAEIALEFDRALQPPAPPVAPESIWGEPTHGHDFADEGEAALADWLAAARAGAERVAQCDGRSRSALYDALGRAYDFALTAEREPEQYAALLAEAGLTGQARAPMTPVVKLVFGAKYDKTRLTEYAAALSHGRRLNVVQGGLVGLLENHAGGLKGVVKAERAHRAPAPATDQAERARTKLRAAPAKATLDIETGDGEFVLLVARRDADGRLAVLAPVDDAAMVDRAVRKVAH